MKTKVVIAGAAGRMGHALLECISQVPHIELAGAVEYPEHPDIGRDSGAAVGLPDNGIILMSDLREALPAADCLIDFTLHTAAPANASLAAEMGRAVVIGATGLNDKETEEVEHAASRVPIVWAPNMSLGVNLLFAMVRRAGKTLGLSYSVEIDETHHVHKKDAPSGTAIGLAHKVSEGNGMDPHTAIAHDPDGAQGLSDPSRIVVRSHREGEVIGRHTVCFKNAAETISFTHHAHSRNAFALGAMHAAAWVVSQRPRLYDMLDVLEL